MKEYKGFFYPDTDKKLVQVHEWVGDLESVLMYCDKKRTCIQAGGAVGVWPFTLAKHFRSVITFEPVAENFACLEKNIDGISNITACKAALFSTPGAGSVRRDKFESGNAGAWYLVKDDSGHVPVVTIDSLPTKNVDLIQLDIEGFELEALKGAEGTISRDSPTIVIEEKPLPHILRDPTLARKWLEARGYEVFARVHRDLIMKRRT